MSILGTIQVFILGLRLRSRKPETRRLAANRLSHLRTRAAAARLCTAVRDSDERVRLTAIYALGEAGDPTVIPTLIDVLKNAGENDRWPDWLTAAESLGRLRAAEAVEPIVQFFDKANVVPDEVHEKALHVVGEIGQGRGALVALYRLGSDRDKFSVHVRLCLEKLGQAAIEPLRQEFLKRRWPNLADLLASLGWR